MIGLIPLVLHIGSFQSEIGKYSQYTEMDVLLSVGLLLCNGPSSYHVPIYT